MGIEWLPGARDGGTVHVHGSTGAVAHFDDARKAETTADIWARDGSTVTVAPCRCAPGSGPISGSPLPPESRGRAYP